MEKRTHIPSHVVKPVYFANWFDIIMFPLAAKLLPYVAKVSFLTPNVVTVSAFVLYVLGCISLFVVYPFHLVFASLFLILAFLGDDLDGQIARFRNLSSRIGDYLDKVLDVLKIYVITLSLAIATYVQTGNVLYIFLGFTACFFFLYRYYIKLETMYAALGFDSTYFEKSSEKRNTLEREITAKHKELEKTVGGKLQSLWLKHRLFFMVDEGEFVVITALGAIFNKLEWALIAIAVAQVTIGLFRVVERGYQLHKGHERLYWPMRK